ncbi:MAG: methionine biosynthesis protein MetW [Victivallaceae bacterium]|nr:methionine biosynthesis protein MetW [Victivallaceae bacterium]
MVDKLKKQLALRPDLLAINKIILPNCRVLDLGCGNGVFLKLLEQEKNVRGLGIELSQEKIIESIATGISVVHGDLNNKLDFADDYSFDYVVVSNTLQEVERPDHLLREVVRVGKKAVVGFINFGYIRTRSQLFLKGTMPETKNLPHHWYNTPNIHLATIQDFRKLCRLLNIKIIKEIPLGSGGNLLAKTLPNLFAANCVFEISSANADFDA